MPSTDEKLQHATGSSEIPSNAAQLVNRAIETVLRPLKPHKNVISLGYRQVCRQAGVQLFCKAVAASHFQANGTWCQAHSPSHGCADISGALFEVLWSQSRAVLCLNTCHIALMACTGKNRKLYHAAG